jgi:hypothetical protein
LIFTCGGNPNFRQQAARAFHIATVVWGVVLWTGAAPSVKRTVLETGLALASVAYGGLLGVFLHWGCSRAAQNRTARLLHVCRWH